jgi:D-galactarolactone isomerase
MTAGGVVPWPAAQRLAELVVAAGWVVNLQVTGETLLERYDAVAALPGPVVIDHIGNFGPIGPQAPAFTALLRLVDTGRVWVKLSAPYARGAMGPFPYAAAAPLAHALVRHAPERLTWGSDWPHTFLTQVHRQPAPDPAALFDLLLDWVTDPVIRRLILVDTPNRLFGGLRESPAPP